MYVMSQAPDNPGRIEQKKKHVMMKIVASWLKAHINLHVFHWYQELKITPICVYT